MKFLTVYHCVQSLLIIIVPICLGTQVAAQEGPSRIVIAHPGQDVELLCNVTVISAGQEAAWIINGKGPYGVNSIHDGSVTGYTTTLGSNNLIVEKIMMNDSRNNSKLKCVIITLPNKSIQGESDPYMLYVAVATQKIPRIVIAHPGQDVTLLCTVTLTSGNPTASWMINDMKPYGLATLHEGKLAGYSSNGSNLIIENVVMNDSRNGSSYNCVITNRIVILRQSYSTILYVDADSPTVITTVTSPATNTATTATADTSNNGISMQPSGGTDMVDDETGNGAVVAIVVVIVILILCGCIIMDILFCYCSKRKEQHDQDNEDDKYYNFVHYFIIVLGVSTLGTSILLRLLYKKLIKQCIGKDKYDIEANSVPFSSPKAKSSKNCSNGHKNECDDFNGEEAYIQDSPSEVSYATTTEALGKDTQIVPAPQYNYARTGGIKVANMPDDGAKQPAPVKPMLEGYAVSDIAHVKDRKKDKKGKADTKSQQLLQYAVVDKNKKKKKKDSKQLNGETNNQEPQYDEKEKAGYPKNELSYMDPGNLEFKKGPYNRIQKSDEMVQYGGVVEGPKYTNIM